MHKWKTRRLSVQERLERRCYNSGIGRPQCEVVGSGHNLPPRQRDLFERVTQSTVVLDAPYAVVSDQKERSAVPFTGGGFAGHKVVSGFWLDSAYFKYLKAYVRYSYGRNIRIFGMEVACSFDKEAYPRRTAKRSRQISRP